MLIRIYLVHIICIFSCFTIPGKRYTTGIDTATAEIKQQLANIEIPGVVLDSASGMIPFTRAGNLIVVKAKADTIEGNFILDTGAPNLVLNITYFRDYPVTHISDAEQKDITGSSPIVTQTEVARFVFGALDYYRVQADLIDMGNIENSKGIKILGLLGVELFKDCGMIIDYEKNLIYLHRINRKESATYLDELLKDAAAYHTLPIEILDNRILVRTELAGKKLKLVIDYAAESNILDSRLPDKVFNNVSITRRVLLNGIGNKKVEALYGDLKSMRVGSQDISNLPVLITNLEYTCFSQNACINGVLGFDFLSLHKIGFNFAKRKMYIWKEATAIK